MVKMSDMLNDMKKELAFSKEELEELTREGQASISYKEDFVDIDQFVMPATERGKNADNYIRELRDNDRL